MKRKGSGGDKKPTSTPEKKPKNSGSALATVLLTNEILLYIFTFLSDLDILSLFRVSKRFHELALRFYLAPGFYQDDNEPILGRGMKKDMTVTSTEHYSHAAAAFRMALQIRNRRYLKGKVPRIMLYRVSDKDELNTNEQVEFTVPGNPLGSKKYIPNVKTLTFYNFQVSGKEKSFWSVEKTAAWILGGIVARLPFVLVTDATNPENFKEGDVRNRGLTATVAIYAREIMQLLASGYTLGFASEGELHKQGSGKVLVLRPPYRTTSHKLRDEMRSTTSRMNRTTIWDRDLKDPKALAITVGGRKITAESLSSFVARERELLFLVATLLAADELSDEVGSIPDSAEGRHAINYLVQNTGGDEVRLRRILSQLSSIERASLRASYQDDLDLVLGYEGRPDEEIQKKVIKIIDQMDGKN